MSFSSLFQERDEEIEALSAALEKKPASVSVSMPQVDCEGPRRSQRLHSLQSQTELSKLHAELDQCRAELLTKTQGQLNYHTTLFMFHGLDTVVVG